MNAKQTHLGIILEDSLKEQARARARALGLGLSSYVRMIIIEHLNKGASNERVNQSSACAVHSAGG